MSSWEYNVIEKSGVPFTSEEFDRYGGEGWELVAVIPSYETMQGMVASPYRYYIFKRQKKA